MANVVRFYAHGKEYGLSIIDRDGDKWITSQQLGEALGNTNVNKLIYELQANGELKREKHWDNLTFLQHGDTQRRLRIILSYRGVIRVAMRSQGSRAKEFRDWAEEVLNQVMMTGSYSEPRSIAPPVDPPEIESRGLRKGLAVAHISSRLNVPIPALAKLCKFRRLGLTQKEAGVACGLTRHQVQNCERNLRTVGIEFAGVNVNKRDKEIMDHIGEVMLGPVVSMALREGGAE